MISIPTEIHGCCSHSMSYGTRISALTSPHVLLPTAKSAHKCWSLPFETSFHLHWKYRGHVGGLLFHMPDIQIAFLSHPSQNTWACSFSFKSKKNFCLVKDSSHSLFPRPWFSRAFVYIMKFHSHIFLTLSFNNTMNFT